MHFEDQLASEKKCGHLGGMVDPQLRTLGLHLRVHQDAPAVAGVGHPPVSVLRRQQLREPRLLLGFVGEHRDGTELPLGERQRLRRQDVRLHNARQLQQRHDLRDPRPSQPLAARDRRPVLRSARVDVGLEGGRPLQLSPPSGRLARFRPLARFALARFRPSPTPTARTRRPPPRWTGVVVLVGRPTGSSRG